MLDYLLWRRRIRIERAAEFWTGTFFALPGGLAAAWAWPVALNTIDGLALFAYGAAAGVGIGAGLACSLRGFFREAHAAWLGFVLGLALVGGALAVHLNADQPETPRQQLASRVVGEWTGHPSSKRGVRALGLRPVLVDWQGREVRIAVDPELALRVGSPLVLSVYDGRFGFPVIEQVRGVEALAR